MSNPEPGEKNGYIEEIRDLSDRVTGLESSLGEVMQRVDDHESRLGAAEKDKEWMLAVLLRVLDGVSDVRNRTTLINQREDGIEDALREILSKLNVVAENAKALKEVQDKLDTRPCLVDCPQK